jgi:hypothetical protein
MKRALMLFVTFSLFGVGLIAEPRQSMAATTPPPVAVLIIACTGAPAAVPAVPYTVATVDGTAGSPTITPGGDCAGAVALAKKSGFWIRRITESSLTLVFIMLNTKDETE